MSTDPELWEAALIFLVSLKLHPHVNIVFFLSEKQ